MPSLFVLQYRNYIIIILHYSNLYPPVRLHNAHRTPSSNGTASAPLASVRTRTEVRKNRRSSGCLGIPFRSHAIAGTRNRCFRFRSIRACPMALNSCICHGRWFMIKRPNHRLQQRDGPASDYGGWKPNEIRRCSLGAFPSQCKMLR